MTQQHEIDDAYYRGLREGFDSEVADDLGIPTDPDAVERHIRSAKEVARLMGAASLSSQVEVANPADVSRQKWIDEMHLTHPSSEGTFKHATPIERQFVAEQMNKVRAANNRAS